MAKEGSKYVTDFSVFYMICKVFFHKPEFSNALSRLVLTFDSWRSHRSLDRDLFLREVAPAFGSRFLVGLIPGKQCLDILSV